MLKWRMNYEDWIGRMVICGGIRGKLIDVDARNIGHIKYYTPFGASLVLRTPMEDVRPELRYEEIAAPIDTYDRYEGHR